MNTEIASSPLYPSVHLLLRASKLAAPVSVAAKTAHSVHASPSGTVKSFSVLNCDCSSTAECRGAVTPGGKEIENKIRKKKKPASLHFARLMQRLSSSPLVDLTGAAAGERANRAEETSSVFASARFLKGPRRCCCGAEGKDASETRMWPETLLLKTAWGRPLWG